MKSLVALLFSLIGLAACQQPTENLPDKLNLPLTVKEGYGPFGPGFSKLSPESPEYPKASDKGDASLPLQGLPKHWLSLVKSRIDLNSQQFFYQSYLAGNIDSKWYTGYKKFWNWSDDTTGLSQKPLNCYLYVIRGYDKESGKWLVMVDTNNNRDFCDETAIEPDVILPGTIPDDLRKPLIIHYEVYQHGKISQAQAPMMLKRLGEDVFYNFPRHAVATFNQEEIPVLGSLTSLDFSSAEIILPNDLFRSGKVDPQKLVTIGQTIELEGVQYRNKGVDLYNNVLRLERVDPNTKEYTLQTGQPFIPFRATEFSTGKTVSLADYKGKYVYIDFWATWCKGCVEDMPELKKLYKELDQNRFAFLGVVAGDKPDRVRAFLKKEAIDWPQIVSDSTDKIAESYKIRGLPISVLLDPTGKIIARDLRGKSLVQKLKAL